LQAEGLLLYSQELATHLYPEAFEFIANPTMEFPEITF
jgi:hypothetical protein